MSNRDTEAVRQCGCFCVDASDLCAWFTENREDMLSPSNNKLTEVLEQANKLFKDGMYDER